ncbi:FMR1-interacting protein NUFIP2 [Pempheris klunzingeri]|uniref:FMR1-interacting protein NUFIP2 n=1 Tax=Pempheris klunzingeri TaxID=3127111 RepID=UPI0039809CB4
MHIKTGTWEASNTVCESDPLCDPAVLVSATNSEPHIRNRRLSPGSGNCGGGGGGGCISGGDQQPRQLSPEGDLIGPGHTHAFSFRRDKERKGQQHKGRTLRRESYKGASRVSERPQKVNQKERWVEDSLSLLKPPPAFPVQDSPAKLQPAVSYASKVKAGATSGALEEDRPAIGVLLQNQWGLSFISDARPVPEGSGTHPAANALPPQPTDVHQSADLQQLETVFAFQPPEETVTQVPTSVAPATCPGLDESNGKLLLSCRHLVEALNYHSREWNAVCTKQKKVPKKVVWYKDAQEHPA